jgi:hypothetical protein
MDTGNHKKYKTDSRQAQIKPIRDCENIIFECLYSNTPI